MAGKLHHANIVPVFGTGVEGSTPFICMELVEGETLASLLARLRATRGPQGNWRETLSSVTRMFGRHGQRSSEPADPDVAWPGLGDGAGLDEPPARSTALDALEIDQLYCLRVAEAVAGVTDGLHFAHRRGVVHRDLKPSNLILDLQGRLRILDFGLATLEGQEGMTLSGDLIGTPRYMSPEQAKGKKTSVDHRTDLFSVGVTLHELLTWSPPFRGKDNHETLSQVVDCDPKPPRVVNPRIPRDLETVVLKCLRKDPRDRYLSAEALGQDLRRFVRGDPVEARPQPGWEKAWRRAQRHKVGITVACLALFLSLVTSLLWSERSAAERERRARLYEEKVNGAVVKLDLGFQGRETRRDRSLPPVSSGKSIEEEGALEIAYASETPPAEEAWQSTLVEAVADLRDAARLLPARPEAHYHEARTLIALRREEDAERALARAIRCDPGFVPAATLAATLSSRSTGGTKPLLVESPSATLSADSAWSEAWIAAHQASQEKRWQDASEDRSRPRLLQVHRRRPPGIHDARGGERELAILPGTSGPVARSRVDESLLRR